MSRKLVTIDTAMKLECSLDDLKVRPSKNEDLRKLFSEFEFSSMLTVLEDRSEETSKTTQPLKKNTKLF